jgi:hypothetical protein
LEQAEVEKLSDFANKINWGIKTLLTFKTCIKYGGKKLRQEVTAHQKDLLHPMVAFGISATLVTYATFMMISIFGINAFNPFLFNSAFTLQASSEIINSTINIYSAITDPIKPFNIDTRSFILTWALVSSVALLLLFLSRLNGMIKTKNYGNNRGQTTIYCSSIRPTNIKTNLCQDAQE